MKYRWSADAENRKVFQVLAGNDPMLQAFLTDRPSFTEELSADVELSGFEWHVLNAKLSQITSNPAAISFIVERSPNHVFKDADSFRAAVNALSMSITNAREVH